MKVPHWTILLFLLFHSGYLTAQQCMPTNDAPGPYICWPLTSSISGSTADYSAPTTPPNFCESVENNGWFSFSPCTPNVVFTIVSSGCRNGVEAVIYDEFMNTVSNCYSSGGVQFAGTITANNLTPGQMYHFMVDGYKGDKCNFVISASEGLGPPTTPSFIGQKGYIQGPTQVCSQSTATYEAILPTCTNTSRFGSCPIPDLTNYYDTTFIWTVPTGGTIIGNQDAAIVTIEWDDFQGGEVSVEMLITSPNNSCLACAGGKLNSSDCPNDFNDLYISKKATQYNFLPTVNLCEGECFEINNEPFCNEGHYQLELKTANGCDSIVEFDIVIHEDKITYLENQFICSGECIIIAGESFCSIGQKEISLNTNSGCDSTIVFEILEKESYQSEMSLIQICEGTSFEINGHTFNNEGNFSTVFQAKNGCDSTVSFEIAMLESSETILPEVGLCEGDGYDFNDLTYYNAGVYKEFRINKNGCDSIVILEIYELENDYTLLPEQSICEGECFDFGGKQFCDEGNHKLTFKNQFGCDSIVEFDLKILEENSVDLPKITLCEGECYNVNERWFCEKGKYKLTLKNIHGCDSIVHFEINFRELDIELATSEIITTENPRFQLNPRLDGSPDNLKIEWKGFQGQPDSLRPIVDSVGIYIVTVTDTIIGCSATDSITLYQLNEPPSTTTIATSNYCRNAPFLCGTELNGYSGKTDSTAAVISDYLQQFFQDSLENPQWIEWTPCDSTVIVNVGVLKSLLNKGIEFSVVYSASCETYTTIINSKKIDFKTVETIQINSLSNNGHYYFVFDGIDGDVCDFQIEIERGIQTEPLRWVMIEAPQISGTTDFCPDVPQKISVSKPVYKLINNHCSFFTDITPIQKNRIVWKLPNQSVVVGNSNSDTLKEIIFNYDDLLPVGATYLQGGQVLRDIIKIYFEPEFTLPNGTYCSIEQPMPFVEKKEISVNHTLKVLQEVDICESSKREFCGIDVNETQEVVCRDGCTTTIQQVNVYGPEHIDRGYVRICPGECYRMPFTRRVICEAGKYTEPIKSKCGGSETVEIGFYKKPLTINIGSITEICDPLNHEHYQIDFTILSGRPPYKVNDEYLELGVDRFLSEPIRSGDSFRFVITDAANCYHETVVEDQYTCGPVCLTDAGRMSSNLLDLCSDEVAEATHFNNSTLDTGDGQEFILHSSPYSALGDVFARNTESDFVFVENAMDYNTTYYISSIVGKVIDGQVDLTDPCLSVSEGQPVIFKQLPNLIIKDSFEINCKSTSVLVAADFVDNNQIIDFLWTMENGDQITTPDFTVNNSGIFQLSANEQNGCSISKTVHVVENFEAPMIDAGATQEIHCEQQHLVLDGQNASIGDDFNYQWSTTDGNILDGSNTLSPRVEEIGTYILHATNLNNGCVNTDSVQVIESTDVFDNATFNIGLPSCYGVADGSIGVNQVLDGQPPYLYSFDGNNFSENKNFTSLQSGTYEILIKDAHNCILQQEITLNEPSMIAVELGDDEFITLGENVMLTAASNIIAHRIEWWNDFGDTHTGHLDWMTQPTQTSTYYVRIEDRRGCYAEDQINVIVKESDIFIPNGFSPNKDEKNDYFTIFGGESVNQILSLKIYNRSGNLLFENYNFPANDELMGWNGFFRGKQMFADVYVFLAEVEFINGDVKVFQGDVTLMR